MVEDLKDVLLVLDVVNMLRLDDLLLLHAFDCEPHPLVFLEACKLNVTKSAYEIKSA